MIKHTYESAYPVLFDALIVVESEKPSKDFLKQAQIYVQETFNHFKPLWVIGEGEGYVQEPMKKEDGVLVTTDDKTLDFIDLVAKHRFWDRNVD